MKYLKKVLLAATLVASTLGMSLSAQAGPIIQQDIIFDIDFADPTNTLGLVEGMGQVVGSITYHTSPSHVESTGDLKTDSQYLSVSLMLGSWSLSLADSDQMMLGGPILAALDPLMPSFGLLYYEDYFYSPDFATAEMSLVMSVEALFAGGPGFFDFIEVSSSGAFGTAYFGDVTYVPEPSVLALLLGGLVLVARRRVAK